MVSRLIIVFGLVSMVAACSNQLPLLEQCEREDRIRWSKDGVTCHDREGKGFTGFGQGPAVGGQGPGKGDHHGGDNPGKGDHHGGNNPGKGCHKEFGEPGRHWKPTVQENEGPVE